MNAAILHDQFRTLGGAERVAVVMARALDAPIYAARVDEEIVPADVEVRELFDGLSGRAMRAHYLAADAAQMLGWQHQEELWSYDCIVYNKTNPLWYQPRDHQTALGYLHSTPRGFYDQFDKRGGGLSTVLTTAMRTLFETNRTQPDAWLCNSDVVQRRAHLYWSRHRDVSVLYPPVETAEFSPEAAETRDYYLTVGRLSGNKRVGDMIRAFRGTDRELVIAGEGSERGRLERLADGHRNINLIGYIGEGEKQRLMSEAKAFILNAECEDFGITPIEAMAAGTPVLGVREGFTRHQIRHKTNGLLYDRGQLPEAIEAFERDGVASSPDAIAEDVERFATSRFVREFRDWVQRKVDETAITPAWKQASEDSEQLLADGGRE